MERLTMKTSIGKYVHKHTAALGVHHFHECVERLGQIEDILGNDYDISRLRELAQADKDGRCVVLPDRNYTNEDGENALKSAMNTCYYHNNPVTRYISDAVAEKLVREAAESALKGE